jgi:hypothetical protein
MRGHRLGEEYIERLVTPLANPVRLALHIHDVVDRVVRESGAGVELVFFVVAKIAARAVDVDLRGGIEKFSVHGFEYLVRQ